MSDILEKTELVNDADEPIGGLEDGSIESTQEENAGERQRFEPAPAPSPLGGEEGNLEPENVGSAEDKARSKGWKPKDEWSGDPSTHVSAEEFLKRGIESKSVVLKDRDKLSEEVSQMRQDMQRQQREAREREAQVAINSMREAKAHYANIAKQARAEKDFDTFEEANRRANDAESRENQLAAQHAHESQNQPDPTFEDFVSRNQWYSQNAVMAEVADKAGQRIHKQEGLRGKALLDKVEQNMREVYPQLFQNPRRQAAPAVESGSGQGRGAAKTSVSSLGPEYKSAFNEFYDDFKGDYKSRAEAEQHYVKMITGE